MRACRALCFRWNCNWNWCCDECLLNQRQLQFSIWFAFQFIWNRNSFAVAIGVGGESFDASIWCFNLAFISSFCIRFVFSFDDFICNLVCFWFLFRCYFHVNSFFQHFHFCFYLLIQFAYSDLYFKLKMKKCLFLGPLQQDRFLVFMAWSCYG